MPALPKLVLVVLLAISAFAIGIYVAGSNHADRPAIAGLLWPDPPQLGAFSLSGTNGTAFTEAALSGKWTLLFFGFTHCPDVCPTTLKTLKTVRDQLAEHPFHGASQVLFVSIDPARDTPTVLRDYVQYFDPGFIAATGSDDQLKRLTRQLGVIYAKVKTADPASYSMDHTASILLIGPKLQLLGVFSPPHVATLLAGQIKAIIEFAEKHA